MTMKNLNWIFFKGRNQSADLDFKIPVSPEILTHLFKIKSSKSERPRAHRMIRVLMHISQNLSL